MTTIRITEFAGYTAPMFLEFLTSHPASFIRIVVPKYYVVDEVPEMLACDYYKALYTGQLLGRISHDIMHSVPDPETTGEFSFIIATERLPELAELLVQLYIGYEGADSKDQEVFDAFVAFEMASLSFLDTLPDDEPLHCPYFLHLINDLE